MKRVYFIHINAYYWVTRYMNPYIIVPNNAQQGFINMTVSQYFLNYPNWLQVQLEKLKPQIRP